MSDSLRNQLLQAGFTETEKKKPNNKKPGQSNSKSASSHQQRGKDTRRAQQKLEQADKEAALVAERKATKATIKTLIEESQITEFAGESVYRFVLGTRIRELYVSDKVREKLNDGSYVITRLNGNTKIVPSETATAIEAINPDWAIVTKTQGDDDDTEYENFKVPDDLQW